jgi:DNA processing protein
MGEKLAALAFSLGPGIGPKRFQKLIQVFGSAEKALKGDLAEFKKAGVGKANFSKFDEFRKGFNAESYLEKLRKSKVEFVHSGNKFYPENLKKIDSPPIGMFTKGNQKLLNSPQIIAVVGSRKTTFYGREVTESLVSDLCSAGFAIVSGMALGVDGVAHRTAIQAQGRTLAVLGCGVDCPYPRENEKLYEEILDSGGLIISEYPLGMQASKGTFPARNRIIAGISSAVLVTEAAEDSGSLITAAHAIAQGKKVFAVPGPITSRMSQGTLKLLKQGAVLVSCADDVLKELNIKNKIVNIKNTYEILNISKLERKVLGVLRNEERGIDEITKLTKIPVARLSTILSEMELSGLVKNSGGKFSANPT